MKYYGEEIRMTEGEVKCSVCSGTGFKPADLDKDVKASICIYCQGHGKLDWIENAMGGKQPEEIIYDGTGITNAQIYRIPNTRAHIKMGV